MIQVISAPADISFRMKIGLFLSTTKQGRLPDKMKQDRIFQNSFLVLIYFSVILFLGSCSQSDVEFQSKSFKSRLQQGDYHLGWSLNYFDSWRNARQPRYLRLAESHSINAINSFASLESDTSPRISEFYVVRERRTRGCRLLAELQFEAMNHGHQLSGMTPQGCIY